MAEENYSVPRPIEGDLRRVANHPESILSVFIRDLCRRAADEIEHLRKQLGGKANG